MLYMIENKYTPELLTGHFDDLRKAEYDMLRDSYRTGKMLRIWRKASGEGAIIIVDLPSPEAVRDWLASIPMVAGFSEIKVTPLSCNPQFKGMDRPDSADRIAETIGDTAAKTGEV